VVNIPTSYYEDYFDYSNCEFCTIDSFLLSEEAEVEGITIKEDGVITTQMGIEDAEPTFTMTP